MMVEHNNILTTTSPTDVIFSCQIKSMRYLQLTRENVKITEEREGERERERER
jgi:hypothetical protein